MMIIDDTNQVALEAAHGPVRRVRLAPRAGLFGGLSLNDFFTSLFYHKRMVILAFAIPCLLGIAAGLFAHTSYSAQARLLVLYGSDYVFHPGNRDTGNDIALDRNQIMQGELQIIESPALIAETLTAVGPDKVYPNLPTDGTALSVAVRRLTDDLSVTSIPQSNVIELTLRNADRTVSIHVLNELITHYLSYRAGIFDKSQPHEADNERNQFAVRLRQAEDAVAQFSILHGISNLDEQMTLLLRQKTDNANELSIANQAIGETAARATSLHQQLAKLQPTIQLYNESARSQQSTGLTDALVKLQIQRRELLARYQDDYPLVRDVDQQINNIKAQIAAEPGRESNITRLGRNPIYDQLNQEEISLTAQSKGLSAKKTQLVADGERIQSRINELTDLTRQFHDLQRTRDVLDASYRSIARSNEETQLSDALERARGANVRVVQPPDVTGNGRSQRVLLMIGGLALGVVTAVFVFLLLNATRRVFVTSHDVEHELDLPVLLAVSLAPSGRRNTAATRTNTRPVVKRASFGV